MNHYNVLGITSQASLAEIKAAYRRLARSLHPDKNGDCDNTEENDCSTTDSFISIQQAWECLGDESKRKEYDQELQLQHARCLQKQSSAIPLHLQECHYESIGPDDGLDQGEEETILVYTCRCGCTLEVDPDADDCNCIENTDSLDDNKNNDCIVECPDCSLVYDTKALSQSYTNLENNSQ